MINLNLYPKFKQDTLGANLNVIPMVIVDGSIFISQVKQTFAGQYWKDINLKINSIKESVDFEDRKFKISNVSITLSNYEIDGQRFSDGNYMNKEVLIYWKSQSCESLEDCILVYQGIVRRFNHNTETVTLELEDLTEQKMHKEIPISRVGDDIEIQERYRNKPYPMVYGYVDKSPCIIWTDSDKETFILADKDIELNGFVNDNLWVYKDRYYAVKEYRQKGQDHYNRTEQYEKEGDAIKLPISYDTVDSAAPEYSIGDDILQGHIISKPTDFELLDSVMEYDVSQPSHTLDNQGFSEDVFIQDPEKLLNNTGVSLIPEPQTPSDAEPIAWNNVQFKTADQTHFDNSGNKYWGSNVFIDQKCYKWINDALVDMDIHLSTWIDSFFHLSGNEVTSYNPYIKVASNRIIVYDNDWLQYPGLATSLGSIYYSSEPPAGNYETIFDGLLDACPHYSNPLAIYEVGENAMVNFGDWHNIENILLYVYWDNNPYDNLHPSVRTILFDRDNHTLSSAGQPLIESSGYPIYPFDYFVPLGQVGAAIKGITPIFKMENITGPDEKESWRNIIIEGAVHYTEGTGGLLQISVGGSNKDSTGIAFHPINSSNVDSYGIVQLGVEGVYLFDNDFTTKWADTGTYNNLALRVHVGGGSLNAKVYLSNLGIEHYIDFEKAIESDYYADIEGRTDGDFIETPDKIISHIIKEELAYIGDLNPEELNTAEAQHNNWRFGFTQTDKINSKNLIEEISASSKLMPKFRNDGTLGFTTIKDQYNFEDASEIKSSDIIRYSFSRTDIEDVKSRIKVFYKKDYATDDYERSTEWLFASEQLEEYDIAYFGLEDDADSSLEFESDYIRDGGTASLLQRFLLYWYCNQHTKFKLTLPIRYLYLEVGDVVRFDSMLDGMKAYGEDYTQIAHRNGQPIYPAFMITSINKNPDKIEVEATQLHYLKDDGLHGWVDVEGEEYTIYGCMNEDALNYNPNATEEYDPENSSCRFRNGDINNDGYINVQDILMVVNHIIGPDKLTGTDFDVADLNEDGMINIQDLLEMINIISGGGTIFEIDNHIERSFANGVMSLEGYVDIIDSSLPSLPEPPNGVVWREQWAGYYNPDGSLVVHSSIINFNTGNDDVGDWDANIPPVNLPVNGLVGYCIEATATNSEGSSKKYLFVTNTGGWNYLDEPPWWWVE